MPTTIFCICGHAEGDHAHDNFVPMQYCDVVGCRCTDFDVADDPEPDTQGWESD